MPNFPFPAPGWKAFLAWPGRGWPLLAAIVVLSSAPLRAQEAALPAPATETDAAAPVPAAPAVPPAVQRNIYLPYEELEAIFEREGRGVFVPYQEFLQLWNELNEQRAAKPQEEPPVPGVVRSADYEARLTGTGEAAAMRIKGRIQIESFRQGWATVPLGRMPLNIVDAKTGDASLHLGDEGYVVVLPRQGIYDLEISFLAAVRKEDEGQASLLRFPRSPVSRLAAVVPGQDWKFRVGGNLPFSVVPAGADSRVELSFGDMQELEIAWMRPSEDSKLTPLLFAETMVRSRVVPGALQTTVEIDYRILRAGVDAFELEVPASHEVLQIEGENLKEWVPAGTGDRQRVAVRLHGEVRDTYRLRVELEKSLKDLPGEVEVPALLAVGVARQSGVVEVSAPGDLEVAVGQVEGLTQQVSGERDGEGFSARYRFLKAPFSLGLRVDRARPEVQVDSLTLARVLPDAVEWKSVVTLEVTRAPLFEAVLAVPSGFRDWRVSGEDVEDFRVEGDRVNVRLVRSMGRSSFRMEAVRPRETSVEALLTPLAEVVGATGQTGRFAVEVDAGLDAVMEETGGLLLVESEALGAELAEAGLDCRVTLAFRHGAGAAPGRITFLERRPQVTAAVSQLVRIGEESTVCRWWIDYEILFAGTNRFLLRIPREIADQLQVGSTGLLEVDRNFRHVVDGQAVDPGEDVFWAVTAANRQQGKYRLELALETPHEPFGFEAERPVPVSMVRLVDVFRQSGQIAIDSAPNLQVGDARAEELEPIDGRELGAPLAGESFVRAYRYASPPARIQVPVRKNRFVEVPRAIVTHADVNAVLSGDGALTTEAIYWMRNAAESALRVRLPEGARVVSDVTVDDRSQPPVSQPGGNEMLVRLPSGSSTRDKLFPVRFVYELPSGTAGQSLPHWGKMIIPIPEIRDLNVLQTRSQLFLPPEFRYVGFEGPHELSGKGPGWREARGRLDFLIPTLGAGNVAGVPVPRTDPPVFEPATGGGLSAPMVKEGQAFRLDRLGAPAPVTVSFLSQAFSTVIEAVLCLLALAIGLSLARASMEARFLFLVFAGLLPLALSGMVAPHLADVYRAVFLGALGSLVGWFIAGIWWLVLPRAEAGPVPAVGPGPLFLPHAHDTGRDDDPPEADEPDPGEEPEMPETPEAESTVPEPTETPAGESKPADETSPK